MNGSNNSEVLNREVYYKLKMDDQSENKHVLISFTDQSTKGLDPDMMLVFLELEIHTSTQNS